MKHEKAIGDLYRVIGWLEGITMLPGGMISGAAKAVLVDCVDRLELVGAQLLAEDVNSREGTEEATRPEQADQ